MLVECDDTGGTFDDEVRGAVVEPQQDISVRLRQGSNTWKLATVDANRNFTFNAEVGLPASIDSGEAELRAESQYELVKEPISVLTNTPSAPSK